MFYKNGVTKANTQAIIKILFGNEKIADKFTMRMKIIMPFFIVKEKDCLCPSR